MKNLLFVSLLLMLGCNTPEPVPQEIQSLRQPISIVHLDVIVNKYSPSECKNRGGMWLQGDLRDFYNVFSGCVEKNNFKSLKAIPSQGE